MTDTNEKSVLTIILDVNPLQRLVRNDPKVMTQCIDAVTVFANAHLMESSTNELAVLACHGQGAKFLYPKPDKPIEIRQFDGQYEKLTLVERTVRSQLQETINELLQCGNLRNESLISGALSLALCYISRLERDKAPGEKLHSRVLIVTGSNDSATQYMNYMNIFFTSQKMWVFLPNPAVRTKLVLPPPVKVDYRAACFCHHELIDIGYVCSICLSIFCKFSPICTTCHTLFKAPAPIPAKIRKKKKHSDVVH
ncbi:hypothetical protein G9C98_006209 [Cotesia typhae]|uniref:General transcription factor IIH subunit 3 n=1 Tax=Cotesia typhae TaxID=2053667 RepID=A0A8J5R4Q7_9HYME|nr:hypothetical protein G9C98_006209 [Cotesia typhae]